MTTFFDPVVTVERIGAQAAMLKAKKKLDMIAVDYLQIVSSKGGERRDLDIGHVTIGLKNMAKRLNVPVVAGAQINRATEKSGVNVRPPRASDLRESGNIEQDADVVIAIHRPGYYDKRTRGTRGEVLLNRDGETGIIRLEEDFARSRFLPSQWAWEDGGDSSGSQGGFD
jgi:replicative DNA helicase